MDEWSTVRVEDFARRIAMGPFGSNIKTENFVTSGVPVIRGGNLSSVRLDLNGLVFLSESKADELRNSNAFPGDLVFTHRGTLGQVGLIPNQPYPRYVVSQSQMLLSCDRSKAFPEFIYYFFRSPIGQRRLLANSSQVGVPAIARPTASLKSIEVPLPTVDEQKRIAQVLASLDDKIELNGCTTGTLEAMVQAIFRDWFVDFGPVRRKQAGVSDPVAILGNMIQEPSRAAEFSALFPTMLGDDGLPLGWTNVAVGELCTIKGGKQLPKGEFVENGQFPVFGGAGHMGQTDKSNADGYVITVGRVGAYCGNFVSYRGPAWVNNNASEILPNKEVPAEWLFLALKELDINLIKKGAAQPFVSNGDLAKMAVIWPGANIAATFCAMAAPLMIRAEALQIESRTLGETRDYLLPRLVSGKVRIDDAEVVTA